MRKTLLPALVIMTAVLLLVRLFYLQVIDDTLRLKSENNAIKINYIYPERGYIFDRTGKLLVANQPSYDIMVVPREVKDIDVKEFCSLLHITEAFYEEKMRKAKVYSPMLPSVFLPQLNKEEYSMFQEKLRRFTGFYIQKRSLRDYQVDYGANVFGFITQVNERTIEKNKYYVGGDLIGKQGVEESYEEILRGQKGVKYVQKDKFNREIGSYKEGKFDTIARQGEDVTLTIDASLQEYGEQLMINKRGGIVAIEPKTGEILALVTAPSYDPSILVGRKRSANYTKLYRDSIAKPLYDRGLLAEYPPGSPFKILTGLIALQEGVIDPTTTTFSCRHGFSYARGRFMKCHCHGGVLDLHRAIYESCNTFFSSAYIRTVNKYRDRGYGVDVWAKHLKSFGLGDFMGYDLPTGRRGNIPSSKSYNKTYKGWKWDGKTIVSNAIGQGEVLMTPVQLANFMATIANRGYYYTPHIIKKIEGRQIDKKFRTRHVTTIDRKYFEPIVSGMFDVYNKGTAHGLGAVGIEICGKTGTAENFAKVNGKRVKLQDHSIFVAFAPKDNPKIAIAVFVENGYWGARWAGPITTLMIEKYLNKKITRLDFEKRMLEGSLKSQYDKLLPVKQQDSIFRIKDSIGRAKARLDSISKQRLAKKDSIKP